MARRFDPVVELYLNGWVDISTRVQQSRGIAITLGAANEQSLVSPAGCVATLNSPGGLFNPDNPMSTYYGLLDRNLPVRVARRMLTDSFSRTSVDSWGTTDTSIGTAQAWTIGATTSDYDVNSGVGKHVVPSGSTLRRSYLAGLSYLGDYEVTVDITLSPSTPGPASIRVGIPLRGQSITNYVAVDLRVTSGGVVSIAILDTDDNTFLAGPTTVAGVTTGGTYRLKGQVEGQTIRGKLWNPSGNNEPYDWQVSAHSSNVASTGWPGLRAVTGSGGGSTTVSYDNLEIRIPRFAGELSELVPDSDPSQNAKTSSMTASGIMRRLGQGKSPAKTTVESYVVGNAVQPIAYWPLDDRGLSIQGRVAAGAGLPAVLNFVATAGPTVNATPGLAFGSGDLGPWLPPVAKIDRKSFIRCGLEPSYSGSWTHHCILAFVGGAYTDSLNDDQLTIGNITAGFWSIRFDSFNQNVLVHRPDTGANVATISSGVYDAATHLVSFRTTQNGANVDWVLMLDGTTIGSGTIISLTNPAVVRSVFQQNVTGGSEDSRQRSIGHLLLYSGDGPSVAEVVDAAFGHVGESAGRRIERLCSQQGIPFSYVGDLDATPAMGPQNAQPAFALMREAEAVDMGTLKETRGLAGLTYVTRESKFGQPARAALDYTAGHIAEPLKPVHDDRATRNQITVKRDGGGEYTATQTSGPNNVNDPGTAVGAVGLYDHEVTVNALDDDQLPDIAGWLLHLGTDPQPRFPVIKVELAASGITDALEAELLATGVDDRITVDNLSAADIYDQVTQLASGYRETLSTTRHNLDFNCSPESPWHVMEFDDGVSRWDSDASTLTSNIAAAPSSFQVTISDGTLWTTDAAQFPLDVKVGGQRMTISGISGASSPQTFTVSNASVNGVSKIWDAATKVSLAEPSYWG
jgi:hypothetical protein